MFLPLLPPPQVFTARGFEALFPCAGTLDCVVYFTPQLFLLVYLHSSVGPLVCKPPPCQFQSLNCHFTRPVLQPQSYCTTSLPGCLSLPLLPVWMNVSSLTPWLSDFHTVRFSGSSDYFLFLNLLLSFFRLYINAFIFTPLSFLM